VGGAALELEKSLLLVPGLAAVFMTAPGYEPKFAAPVGPENSCGIPDVGVMQSINFRELYDLAHFGGMNRSNVGRVHVQRSVWAPLVVIGEITTEDSFEMALVENNDVIQTLSSNAADNALGPAPQK